MKAQNFPDPLLENEGDSIDLQHYWRIVRQ